MRTAAAAVKSEPPKRNRGENDEDAYWVRINSFAVTGNTALGRGRNDAP
jgi:hypothetical protein